MACLPSVGDLFSTFWSRDCVVLVNALFYEVKRAKQTFMIPVNMKAVDILILHSIFSTFSCVTVDGSSVASSHFSL